MFWKSFSMIAVLLFIVFSAGYFIDWQQDKTDELLDQLQTRIDVSEEWVSEHTEKESEYLHVERDSGLVVIKVDKELYKVMYDMNKEEISYVILKDEIIYEKD